MLLHSIIAIVHNSTMVRVKLVFPDLQALVDFMVSSDLARAEVRSKARSLDAYLNNDSLFRARIEFGAKVKKVFAR